MAISIKNHEDRITALEKKRPVWTKIADAVKLSTSYTKIFEVDNHDGIVALWYNYANRNPESRHVAFMQLGLHIEYEVELMSAHEYILGVLDNNSKPGKIIFNACTRGESISDNYVESAYLLKLYYNFSYNITREFYKVKFKLKHYLCSHLQKFI